MSPARTMDFVPRKVVCISPSRTMKVLGTHVDAAPAPDVHINDAEMSVDVVPAHGDGVGIIDQPDVR